MKQFFGFDLGDAESAIACLNEGMTDVPQVLEMEGAGSFVTAYAIDAHGKTLIGERACYADSSAGALRFKSHFLTDPSSENAVRLFASAVLARLYENGHLLPGDDSCFYIGCPAGWDANTREVYRELFEKAGYPPLKIVSESRAALISACQSKHLQIGVDILSKTMLVVDIGSSTTDFAYINNGHETAMQTAGEVALGGGLMDEVLLQACVEASPHADLFMEVFEKSPSWKRYCEFSARRLKERYFAEQDYWQKHSCRETVMVQYDRPLKLTLQMDSAMENRLLNEAYSALQNRSFKDVFQESLRNIRNNIGTVPELIFLTGGVSRLPAIRRWCMDLFPEAVIISGSEPEFAVCRGLAWTGRIDEELKAFRSEVSGLIASNTVENIVLSHIDDLYDRLVDRLVEPVILHAARPVLERWRHGEIKRLEEADEELALSTEQYLHSEEAHDLLAGVIAGWLKTVAGDLEEVTMPLCIRHHVPYSALSLNTYLSVSDLDFQIETKDVFAVEQLTWLIDSIITVVVGLLCGGSGIALISSGPAGIAVGALLSLAVLAAGKAPMEKALLKTNIPHPLRHMIPKDIFDRRLSEISRHVKDNFYKNLSDDKREKITQSLVHEISAGIETCLSHMAEIVEIPLVHTVHPL